MEIVGRGGSEYPGTHDLAKEQEVLPAIRERPIILWTGAGGAKRFCLAANRLCGRPIERKALSKKRVRERDKERIKTI